MALQKEIVLKSGVSCSYWCISSLKFNKKRKNLTVEILGYTNKQARDSEKTFVVRDSKNFEIDGFEFSFSEVYTLLKNTEMFLNSTDC